MDIVQKKLKKNIVILGAGFAGLRCALELEKLSKKDEKFLRDFNIVLIDKNSYSLYTPSLYEVATTAKADASGRILKKIITVEIEEIIRYKNIKFVQGEISHIVLEKNMIRFKDDTLMPFEYVVLALGAEPNYFGIEGLKEHSISLKWLPDAIRTRNRVREIFLKKKDKENIKAVIGGSGPNGIEVAAELPGYLRELNKIYGRDVGIEIIIIDGAPTVLNGFGEKVSQKAAERLKEIHIGTKLNFFISKVDEKNVYLKPASASKEADSGNTADAKAMAVEEESLEYDLLMWSGGVKVNSILQTANAKKERNGKMEANSNFECIDPDTSALVSDKIFAIGDNSCFHHPTLKRPMAGTARVAIEEAKIAARNLYQKAKGNKTRIPYMPEKDFPFSIPIGGKYAITKYKGILFTGFSGWVLKQAVELYYLYSITDKISVCKEWWQGIKIFSKND